MLLSRAAADLADLIGGGIVHETAVCRRSSRCRHKGAQDTSDCGVVCLPRFRSVLQIDGDSYLKIWCEAPLGAVEHPEKAKLHERRFEAGLRRHQESAATRFRRSGQDLARLGLYLRLAANVLSSAPSLAAAIAAAWQGQTCAALLLAVLTPVLLAVCRTPLRRLLLRLLFGRVMRLAYRYATQPRAG